MVKVVIGLVHGMGHVPYVKMRSGCFVSYPFLSHGAMVLEGKRNTMSGKCFLA